MKINLNLADYWVKSVSLPIGFGLMLFVLVSWYFSSDTIETNMAPETLFGMAIDSEERIHNRVKTIFLTIELEDSHDLLISLPSNIPVRLGTNVESLKIKSASGHENDFRYSFSKYIN